MKSNTKVKEMIFVQFAREKKAKRTFDGALVKLGIDNKWSTK